MCSPTATSDIMAAGFLALPSANCGAIGYHNP
jgi:hypothetical protein